jgi:hypothetical protein
MSGLAVYGYMNCVRAISRPNDSPTPTVSSAEKQSGTSLTNTGEEYYLLGCNAM